MTDNAYIYSNSEHLIQEGLMLLFVELIELKNALVKDYGVGEGISFFLFN
ncbi:hypothetical protein [Psychrobacillus vulpis]|nr:hypothetical protein [Psychrobacillus vulpis]